MNTKKMIMVVIIFFLKNIYSATLFHNVTTQAFWVTLKNIQYDRGNDVTYTLLKRIQIVLPSGKHINLDKKLKEYINMDYILTCAYENSKTKFNKKKIIQKFILLNAEIEYMETSNKQNTALVRVMPINTQLPYSISIGATNTIKYR